MRRNLGFFTSHLRLKVFILFGLFGFALSGLLPFGANRVISAYTVLIFFSGFYIYVYHRLKFILAILLLPFKVKTAITLPPVGSNLYLSDFNLSNRQKQILMDYIQNGNTYNEISDKFIVSLSTVKSEMASIFKKFGVSNKEDFRILLLQYKIS